MSTISRWAGLTALAAGGIIICASCFGWREFSAREQAFPGIMPMADDFPGLVDSSAPRVIKTVNFQFHPRDVGLLRMYFPPRHQASTGLYWSKGDPLSVNIHASPSNQSGQYPWLRIGAHTFDLDSRYPGLDQARPGDASAGIQLKEGIHRFSPQIEYSGLLYLHSDEVGEDSFRVTIAGAVQAPWFKKGRDSLKDWRERIRDYPAPWAELEGDYAILTLPSAMIRQLDDPEPVIAMYDQAVKEVQALVGLRDHASDPRDQAPGLPFRFIMDHAITIHANRPDILPQATSYDDGIDLNWMAYDNPARWITPGDDKVYKILIHELGHHYEPVHRWFEPPGAAEGFAELFYISYQKRAGHSYGSDTSNFPGLFRQVSVSAEPSSQGWLTRLLSEYVFPVGHSRSWSSQHYGMLDIKIGFMARLVQHLPHDFIARLYHRFRHTPKDQLPAIDNQQQKTDFFFELLCEVTEQDLSLLFRRWYVPVSEQAYQRVAAKGYPYLLCLYEDALQ